MLRLHCCLVKLRFDQDVFRHSSGFLLLLFTCKPSDKKTTTYYWASFGTIHHFVRGAVTVSFFFPFFPPPRPPPRQMVDIIFEMKPITASDRRHAYHCFSFSFSCSPSPSVWGSGGRSVGLPRIQEPTCPSGLSQPVNRPVSQTDRQSVFCCIWTVWR